jgi:hypothetical protein
MTVEQLEIIYWVLYSVAMGSLIIANIYILTDNKRKK